MPNSIQNSLLHDESVGEQTRINMEEIHKKFSSIFSNNNLGLNDKTVTADTTLTNEDSVVFVDTSAATRTITLPLANSWGSNKSAILVIVKTSTSNSLTIVTQGSDTINYFTSGIIVSGSYNTSGTSLLISDGSTKWFSIKDELGIEFPATTTITGATTLTTLNRIVVCGNSAGNYNVTLPLANSASGLGQIIHIQRDGNGAAIVATVIKQGADTLVVDPAKTAALAIGAGCTVVSDGISTWLLH